MFGLRRPAVLVLALTLLAGCAEIAPKSAKRKGPPAPANPPPPPAAKPETTREEKSKAELPAMYDWQSPNPKDMIAFKDEQPIYLVSAGQNRAEWEKLAAFWNEVTEKVTDPSTGQTVDRKAVKIKVPLGLTQSPPVPAENPLSVQKWTLGKQLYFDGAISADGIVSCAICHDPKKGYTDQTAVSSGSFYRKAGFSAPTLLNIAYNPRQFWDGRADSLEDFNHGPPEIVNELTVSDADSWRRIVERVRGKPEYVRQFKQVFGHEPTRDALVKAVATYERLVLSGNALHDRADAVARKRGGVGAAVVAVTAADYEAVLKEAFTKKDANALTALGLDADKDAAKAPEVAKSLKNGRDLFFDKARCSTCHTGDNFTDYQFHNLGVGARDGKIPEGAEGRFAKLPSGHKHPAAMGAFKTPTLRGLTSTAPYLHDGSEKTLEDVVNFFDRGGNANPYLSPLLRDLDAERAYQADPKAYNGPEVKVFAPDGRPVIPLQLKLTDQEKKDLVLFLRALQGDPVDPIVAEKEKMPGPVAAR